MGTGRFWVGGTLAVLLGTSSSSGLPFQASPLDQGVAQVTSNTFTGQLDDPNSETIALILRPESI